MKTETVSLAEARRLALQAGSGLYRPRATGARGVAEVVERMGFVQIDTIHVVERAHHHVLWTRMPDYRPALLDRAAAFEYWAHAAALLPWKDFAHTLPRKARIVANGHDWFRVDTATTAMVLERIRSEGPLLARDFESVPGRAGWWDWKPAKRALEYLFMAGVLMVRREGFQKRFDLTERVLPPGTDCTMPSPGAHAGWMVGRALDAWGIAARDEMGYLREEHTDRIDEVLEAMVEEGSLVRLRVEGLGETPHYARPGALEAEAGRLNRKLRILSPFDPFLIHRKRLRRLWGFDFSLECYLPAEKRRFGYFALPLFRGDGFVGALDAKANRQTGLMEVKALRLDVPPRQEGEVREALEEALEGFAAFNGVAWETGSLPGTGMHHPA